MVLAAALDRVKDDHDEPLFIVKGGVAMELRLRLKARATKDFDTFFRESAEMMLGRLDEALRQPHGNFRFQRSEARPIGPTGTQRIEVQVIYNDRVWQRVALEVALAEGRMAEATEIERLPPIEINQFGLDGPAYVSCIPVRYQIAQKLHACTERFESGPENDRFRDLVDLILLRGLIEIAALPRVREACVEIFEIRRKHSWPPELVVPDSWPRPFEALARELEFAVTDVHEAAELVRELIGEIDAAR